MDDELQQLEAELKRLRPAAPTRDFLARMEREFATPAPEPMPVRRVAPLWWFWVSALPAAASLALMITFAVRTRTQSVESAPPSDPNPVAAVTAPNTEPMPSRALESPATFKPVAAENVLYAAQDEGVVTLADGTPARRERLNYVDTIVWKNPRTNASVRWTVPREEVRVVPVKFQ
jgi:hypothetical protein